MDHPFLTSGFTELTTRYLHIAKSGALTHRAQETPYGARNCLLRIPDIPIWCLCLVALNPGYPHIALRILQQKQPFAV